jgi:2-C-methyl-D-erythritol 4-phosphate cytidylyltransferase
VSGRLHAVVVAAGSGERFRAGGTRGAGDAGPALPKQFVPLAGRPVIAWSLAVLAGLRPASLLVVTRPALACHVHALALPGVRTVAGGDTRADSVRRGVDALEAGDDDWVLVHDAARPCISDAACRRLLAAVADDAVGGLLAVRASDTVKLAGSGTRVARTLPRGDVWLAQTPQVFRCGVLRQGFASALALGRDVTDEAAAVELLGLAPLLVEGDADNLKLTDAADLERAARVLAARAT